MKSHNAVHFGLAVCIVLLSGCTSPGVNNDSANGSITSFHPTVLPVPSMQPASSSPGYITYANPNYGIKMTYPSDLKKQEEITGETIFFLSARDSTTEAYPANLDIMVLDLSSQPLTLDEFTNQSLEQISGMVPDYRLTDSRKAALSKEDAYLIAYTGTQGLLKLKWMSVYTIKNDTLYLLTYTAGADRFQTYLPAVSRMLDSFEITA